MSQGDGGFFSGTPITQSTLAAGFRTKLDVSALDALSAANAGSPGPAGPAGPPGPAGPIGLGVLVPWKSGTVYSPGPLPSYVGYAGSSYRCYAQHTAGALDGTFAGDLAAGYWGAVPVAAAGATGPSGSAATQAQVTAATQALLGQPTGIAQLDTSGRQLANQDQVRAWQVARVARPALANLGGSWSDFRARYDGGEDALDGSHEAFQGGTPAPVNGVLAALISAYLQALGLSTTQAAAQLGRIFTTAPTIQP